MRGPRTGPGRSGLRQPAARVLLVLAMLVVGTWLPSTPAARADHTPSPTAAGVYRVPYANGTQVRITRDHHDHSPVEDRIDMVGEGPGPYEIVAAADGEIMHIVDSHTEEGGDCEFNNYVWIAHPNGEWTKYSHLRPGSTSGDAGLVVGEQVSAGTFLGYEDDIGCASGEHLHWEVAVPDDLSDPIQESGGYIKGENRVPVICDIPDNTFVSGETYTAADCRQAELELVSMQLVDAPTEIPVNTPVPITVRTTVRNNGSEDVTDAVLLRSGAAPGDCSLTPVEASETLVDLSEGQAVAVDRDVVLECAQPSFHDVGFSASLAPADIDVVDADPDNNAGTVEWAGAVIAPADLAVAGLDLSGLDGAGLDDLLVGSAFPFTSELVVSNHGDTVNDPPLYGDPVAASVSRSLDVPAGVEGAVTVAAAEAPATVVVSRPNQPDQVLAGRPAGSVVAADGPATLLVRSSETLTSGASSPRELGFALRCLEGGAHDVAVAASVVPVDPHVEDIDASNDALAAGRTIDCVVPVQINVKPGSMGNPVNPASKGVIPVAVLTTVAGEYGLPVAFDATSLDALSVRFAPQDVLEGGGGAGEAHGTGHLEDALETDEITRDGDLDAVLHFRTQQSGMSPSTTELCVVGSFLASGGETQAFFGCDAVTVVPA